MNDSNRKSIFVLWKGGESGPFSQKELRDKIAAREVSMLHQVRADGKTMSIREWLQLNTPPQKVPPSPELQPQSSGTPLPVTVPLSITPEVTPSAPVTPQIAPPSPQHNNYFSGMFCSHCGSEISDKAVICVKCGVATGKTIPNSSAGKSRVAYILLGIFLGGFGIHNFYAGYSERGVAQLLITIFLWWLIYPIIIIWIWIILEICTVNKDAQGIPFS